ncbi:MAG: ClpXP protease specificity-enhancing factor [Gammaproteobacteria bacterium]|nr:ClpXP protease specificity-enhancing factor [Gammaproteobacteria bacterium]MCW8986671.1 ClpXP protease specificity-enhancing factor [Gammaproteobacteria bacterium]MCW9030235.1 ClpXP protease specificity-enhancing factor [Gammaproteobacteria bacterium]
MTSSQPYLIRAIYDWIIDNGFTPYLLVNAENDYAMIPREYVEDGKIVLNINPSAISDLQLGNDYIMFNARFSGKAMEVSVPIVAVLAIYARENGQGMMFDGSSEQPHPPTPPENTTPAEKPGKSKKPQLKVVK